ncbi:MAG: hypothetical protein J6Y31_07000 [Bacteroidales bacterium]|nr:hypothetical protein [Bacteroidales bacterium]
MDFADFILEYSQDNPAALALQRERLQGSVSDFGLAISTLESRAKLRDKLPEWYVVPALHLPLPLSAEQCSSSATAFYKASLCKGLRVADLTGGLGVDSWAFSQSCEAVLYNEMQPALVEAARHNFPLLGMQNVQISQGELTPDSLADILGDFGPDVIFLDPARRADSGRKVFRLEDCSPRVLPLLPALLDAAPLLMLKLSPMADISLLCRELGCVRELHIIEAERECKELLVLLSKESSFPPAAENYFSLQLLRKTNFHRSDKPTHEDSSEDIAPAAPRIFVAALGRGGQSVLQVPAEESSIPPAAENYFSVQLLRKTNFHRSGEPTHEDSPATPSDNYSSDVSFAGLVLFEPGKGLLKAGAFELPLQYGLCKLHRHTHLYTCSGEVPSALEPFGKVYRILDVKPLDKRGIREMGKAFPKADVTARNLPLTSAALQKKLGCNRAAPYPLFGVLSDSGPILIACIRE